MSIHHKLSVTRRQKCVVCSLDFRKWILFCFAHLPAAISDNLLQLVQFCWSWSISLSTGFNCCLFGGKGCVNYRTDKFLVHEENALVCFVTWPWFQCEESGSQWFCERMLHSFLILFNAYLFKFFTETGNYTCEFCGKQYKYYTPYQEHVALHAPISEYPPGDLLYYRLWFTVVGDKWWGLQERVSFLWILPLDPVGLQLAGHRSCADQTTAKLSWNLLLEGHCYC